MKPDKIRELLDERWPEFPVAATQQLSRVGLEDRILTAAVRTGLVIRLRRGAYVRSTYWHGLKPWCQRWSKSEPFRGLKSEPL
ncbi:type IV toxin-antitoxin system AbiEi family antitoxin domain-containing protein [Paenarthrobacter sp. NEAU-H11]|uniref:type IV toxin-antitoxin system AbiEi family antitoxin domain-containing protein n=1 Tax=Paenarthrobacter sp. NEAU-H11 TaxID=3423924 RepID=UPI003D335BF3